MHDQLHPVLGDAVADRLQGWSDAGGDPRDAKDRFLQIAGVARGPAGGIDPVEVHGREFPESLPESSRGALEDQDAPIADQDHGRFPDSQRRGLRGRCRQPILKAKLPCLAELR